MASIPRAVIADAVGQTVTVETIEGTTYRGRLEGIDGLFNVRLSVGLVRAKDGAYSAAGNVTIAGAQIKLVQLPPVMRNAPFFKEVVSGSFAAKKKPVFAGKKKFKSS
jgi:small nuclear ribonucleoprotein (snRNP)-like protein